MQFSAGQRVSDIGTFNKWIIYTKYRYNILAEDCSQSSSSVEKWIDD